jgi:general secretion pathway protein D
VDEADIRMRDGEVSLLGGVSSDSNSQSIAGLPGISNMPVLGYLFGTRDKERHQDDIIVALIPHIIRAPSAGSSNADGIFAGTERVVRVEHHHETAAPSALQPAPAVIPPAQTTPPAQTGPAGQKLLSVPPSPPAPHAEMLAPTQNPRLPDTTAKPVPIAGNPPDQHNP